MFQLAETLGKSLGEIRAMPAAEITEWMAYYQYRAWAVAREQAASK